MRCAQSACFLRSSFFEALLLCGLASLVPGVALAQATAPAVALGSVNAGSSTTGTVMFTFSASTTVSSVSVLTRGTTGLDFTLNTSAPGTCAATTYAANDNCTVGIEFAPLAPGLRFGAAVLLDSNQNKIASGLVSGIGNGGLAALALSTAPSVSTFTNYQADSAVYDGAGDLFGSGYSTVYELKPDGTSASFTPSYPDGYPYIYGLAMDGAGLLYVSEQESDQIVRFDPAIGTGSQTIFASVSGPNGMAFDTAGNLWVADQNGIDEITPAGTVTNVYSEPGNGIIAIAFDVSGNLYYQTNNGGSGTSDINSIYKISAGQTHSLLVHQISASYSTYVWGLAVDAASNIYFSLYGGNIYEMPAGTTTPAVVFSGSADDSAVALSGTGQIGFSTSDSGVASYNLLAQSINTASGTSTAVDATSAAQSVLVTNDGDAPLNFTSFTGVGAAAATSGYSCATGTPVAVDATCTLGVEFAPTTQGSPQTGTLTVAGNTPSSVVSITGYVAGDPAKLAFTTAPPSALQTGQNAGTVAISLLDNGGNATTSTASVTLTVTGPSGYSQSYTVNAVNGIATFDLSGATLTTTGAYSYTASSGGLTSTPAAGETVYAYALVITSSPATPIAAGGNAGAVQVTVENHGGSTATSQTPTVTLTVTGPNSYSQSYTAAAVNGIASFDLSSDPLSTSGTYSYVASDAAYGYTSSPTFHETVTAGAIASLALTASPNPGVAGYPVNLIVTAYDAEGNQATGNTDSVTLSSSPAATGLPATFNLASGTATQAAMFATLGAYALTATDNTNAGLMATLNFTVNPVPIYTVTVTTDPGTGTAGNCTNQALAGATRDRSCSLRDAFAAVTALGSTGTSGAQPIINFAAALSGSPISLSSAITPTANFNLQGPGASSLTIAAASAGYPAFSSSTASLAMTVSGVTIHGFSVTSGNGGAWNSTGSGHMTTFTNVTFSGNSDTSSTGTGGAVNEASGTLNVTGSTFLSNTDASGGAIAVTTSTTTIATSVFGTSSLTANTTNHFGGAIYATGGSLALTSNSSSNNTSAQYGGAVYVAGGCALALTNNTFTSNQATLAGGALYITASTLGTSTVPASGNIFNANKVTAETTGSSNGGGAILFTYASAGSFASYLNLNLFAGNSTSGTYAYGGAITISSSISKPSITISNSLFSGNTASASSQYAYGGAIDQASGYSASYLSTLTLIDDTFTGNTAKTSATATYYAQGGAVYTGNYVTDTLYNDTLTGNSVSGGTTSTEAGGQYSASTSSTYYPKLYNTIVAANANNRTSGTYPDFYPNNANITGCGNAICNYTTAATSVDSGILLSALGDYGGAAIGPTGATVVTGSYAATNGQLILQSIVPLPGSPALGYCFSCSTNTVPSTETTDSRGYLRSTVYNGATYVDAGATEPNYTLTFIQEPATTRSGSTISPAPSVQVYESGVPFLYSYTPPSGTTYPTLGFTAATGTLSVTSVHPANAGPTLLSATITNSQPVSDDTLTARIGNAAGGTGTLVANATSTDFNVTDGSAATLDFLSPPNPSVAKGNNACNTATTAACTVTVGLYANGSSTVDTTSSAAVTLTVTASGYTTQTYTVNALNGVASFSLGAVGLSLNGTYSYTATASSYTTDTATATQTVAASAIGSFVVSGITTPASLNTPYSFTVTAKDTSGNTLTSFTGPVYLTSSDPLVAFAPQNYTFNASDNGVHTFTVTFGTGGTQTVTATTNGGASGAQTGIIVSDLIWLVNANGTVSELSESGSSVLSAAGTVSTPASFGGVAFDNAGDVWSVTSTANALDFVTKSGTNSAIYSGAGLNAPVSVAVDGAGDIWVANSAGNSVSEFLNSGAAQSGTSGYGSSGVSALNAPSSVAIDNTGGVWVTNKTGSSLTHIFGAATPVVTPQSTAVANGTVGVTP